MAHEYAKINVTIWGDQDWKQLPPTAQWLYFLLWTHPKTSAAGVAEWNPGKIAKHASGITAEDVTRIGQLLQSRRFILVDDDEVLIRSYIKHDQRMKQPNAAVSVANAYAATASVKIQKVIVYELGKLKERQPSFKGWSQRAIQDVLENDGEPIDSYIDPSGDPSAGIRVDPSADSDPSVDPSHDPSLDPWVDPSVGSQPYISVDPSVDHPLTETETETPSNEGGVGETDEFKQWWSHYPKKADKGQARRAFKTARKKASLQQLIEATDNYAAWLQREGKQAFTKNPATWLNAEAWDNPESQPPAQPKQSPISWTQEQWDEYERRREEEWNARHPTTAAGGP